MRSLFAVLISMFSCVTFIQPGSAQTATLSNTPDVAFTRVDCHSDTEAEATGVSQSGTVVGFCEDANGGHGFVWRHGQVQLLNYPGALSTGAIAINVNNTVVGFYEDSTSVQHAFELTGGRYTTIDVPPSLGSGTAVYGINDAGDTVGSYLDASSAGHSFLRHASKYIQVAFPGAVFTQAYGINNAQSIVGFYWNSDQVIHGFVLQGGVYSTVDYPGADVTFPCSINNNGLIFGYYQADTTSHLFVYRDGGSEGFDLVGGTISVLHFELFGINDVGILTGPYEDSSGLIHGFRALLNE